MAAGPRTSATPVAACAGAWGNMCAVRLLARARVLAMVPVAMVEHAQACALQVEFRRSGAKGHGRGPPSYSRRAFRGSMQATQKCDANFEHLGLGSTIVYDRQVNSTYQNAPGRPGVKPKPAYRCGHPHIVIGWV